MDGAVAPSSEAEVAPELAPLAAICAGAVRYMEEGGKRYVYMEGLKFLVRGMQRQMDAILCLNYPNPSYPTKLFLPENLGCNLNWNETAYIFARNWFTWSWKDVPPDQDPFGILAEHLRAFR